MDRTLLDTNRFMLDMFEVIGEYCGMAPGKVMESHREFWVTLGELRHYDFFAHMRTLGLGADEAENVVKQKLGEQDYCYSDVADFLRFLEDKTDRWLVLTHGERRYQYLKFCLCRELAALPFQDVLTPKAEWIRKEFGDKAGILIDDKKVENLPDGFRHVWLQRQSPATHSGDFYTSLTEIAADWQQLVS
jgi:hypothetical protein